jgi:uncharacterized protein
MFFKSVEKNVEINKKNWEMIRKVFDSADTSWHKAVSTVNSDGTPHCAPIGAFFLRNEPTGYFFDSFLKRTAENLRVNKKLCVLAVNSDMIYWNRSLRAGEFDLPPSVRIYGNAILKRKATEKELKKWHERILYFKGTSGYDKLWKDMNMVWDLGFDSFEPTFIPEGMDNDLWVN